MNITERQCLQPTGNKTTAIFLLSNSKSPMKKTVFESKIPKYCITGPGSPKKIEIFCH